MNRQTKESERVKTQKLLSEAFSNAKVFDSAIYYSEKGLQYYKKLQNHSLIGRHQLFIGIQYLHLQQNEKGKSYILKSLQNLKINDDGDRILAANHSLAYLEAINYNSAGSTKYYQDNIDLYKSKKIKNKEYIYLAFMGKLGANYMVQNYASVVQDINEFLSFVEKDYPEKLDVAYQQIAMIYRVMRDFRRSIEFNEKALKLYQKNGNKLEQANCEVEIGISNLSLKNYVASRTYLYKALDYLEPTSLDENKATAYNGLSSVYLAEEKYDEAEKYILKALAITPKEHNLYNTSLLWTIRLSRLTQDSIALKTNPEKQQELINITDELVKNFDLIKKETSYISPNLMMHNYGVLSNSYELQGKYDLAFENYKKGIELRDSIYGMDKMKSMSDAQSNIDISLEKARILFDEESKRLQLQKDLALKALKYDYEKKQALAKTEEERKRLVLEEEIKRKEIELKFENEQEAITLQYEKEKAISQIEQEKKDALANAALSRSRNIRNMSILGIGLALLLVGITAWFYLQKKKDNKRIALEKQKSDELLLNILPHEIAEELKEKGKSNAKNYDEVSVIFTDFVGFTANSERVGVQETLNELNICFTEFDNIMERNGLEKIKTIGDAYLAVSGLPIENNQHAKNAVKAAIDILQFIEKRKIVNPNTLDIRIGIHSGAIIAGIIGVKKFAYDIWGDTVNTAARMEQNSTKGKLNISDATYQLTKNEFQFEYRGKIDTKGKGEMDMYFLINKY